MSKTGLFLLSLCGGIVIGLLLGYQFFHRPETATPPVVSGPADTSGTHQYFYRLNDSLVVRHTVSGSDDQVVHHKDTIVVHSQ